MFVEDADSQVVANDLESAFQLAFAHINIYIKASIFKLADDKQATNIKD